MNITVIGAGYVGLVTAGCFAELGNVVTCIDTNAEKISKLQSGVIPIYEPGLENLILKNIFNNQLYFSHEFSKKSLTSEIFFIAVGTPCHEDGNADLKSVFSVAKSIGENINRDCLIVDKSTVPVGVADSVKNIINNEITKRKINIQIEMVSNPEFLREGAAIQDFMCPDRVIIGYSTIHAKKIMKQLYSPIVSEEKIYFMSAKDAEMTKYVANAMLAARISIMNEVALICEKFEVDVDNVRRGIGSDSRIGSKFLYPGCGYGGSCFPKDVKALIKMAESNDINPLILRAIEERNTLQKLHLSKKIFSHFGEDLTGITIAVWGLSFKPQTDDMRDASSIILLEQMIAQNAKIQVFDPVAIPVAKQVLPIEWITSGKLHFAHDKYDALTDASALVLVTEWDTFLNLDFNIIKTKMRQKIIFDGRNQYDPKILRNEGFIYYGIGRGYLNSYEKYSRKISEEIAI